MGKRDKKSIKANLNVNPTSNPQNTSNLVTKDHLIDIIKILYENGKEKGKLIAVATLIIAAIAAQGTFKQIDVGNRQADIAAEQTKLTKEQFDMQKNKLLWQIKQILLLIVSPKQII
ncbi:hypothetical protein [Sporomusa sphaeroides]|uniref:hypothetical protein n=1 Tax=Sporomusa sphaeroides TaxID=47679 RepID=UPI00202FF6C7|nr:hypothetical protein [Sporomusa sphaeroides]MCM0760715.1 hypothetical protein [Sporomusa sphaeroides DSM 2875]HML32310.1 hypothetical protein [Sporomusa sphaeroides]